MALRRFEFLLLLRNFGIRDVCAIAMEQKTCQEFSILLGKKIISTYLHCFSKSPLERSLAALMRNAAPNFLSCRGGFFHLESGVILRLSLSPTLLFSFCGVLFLVGLAEILCAKLQMDFVPNFFLFFQLPSFEEVLVYSWCLQPDILVIRRVLSMMLKVAFIQFVSFFDEECLFSSPVWFCLKEALFESLEPSYDTGKGAESRCLQPFNIKRHYRGT